MSATAEQTDRVVDFAAGDGFGLQLINVRGPREPTRGPVLLVHGAGVRANIFRAPSGRTLVDALLDDGYDVWLENWRASIDFEPNPWTLDQAAVLDHPFAVRELVRQTGAEEIKAVIHCQGSTSFAMSAVAGLVPEVTTIVSNAVSLHPIVNPLARAKLRWLIPVSARAIGYMDPQWAIRGSPWLVPKLVSGWVRLAHRECANPVCKLASYTYGTGEPTLWRHENLNRATHDWLTDEFAHVPLTFFTQMRRCVQAGGLVSVDGRPELPSELVAQPPRTDARFAFFAGELNACFAPESQVATHAWFERHAPDRHTLHLLPRYGHLDVFMGAHAAHDVFPLMLEELKR